MRLGITGYAGAGKDAVADLLVENHGFVKINMSDALHDAMLALDPIINIDGTRYCELIYRWGYVEAKRDPEVRMLLQRLGTEVGRALDQNIWVKAVNRKAQGLDRVVTTGIRFPNEVEPLDVLVWVDRPGVGPINDHPSDDLSRITSRADYVLVNDGDLEYLEEAVEDLANWLGLENYQ